jgi:hypothetical protein
LTQCSLTTPWMKGTSMSQLVIFLTVIGNMTSIIRRRAGTSTKNAGE